MAYGRDWACMLARLLACLCAPQMEALTRNSRKQMAYLFEACFKQKQPKEPATRTGDKMAMPLLPMLNGSFSGLTMVRPSSSTDPVLNRSKRPQNPTCPRNSVSSCGVLLHHQFALQAKKASM